MNKMQSSVNIRFALLFFMVTMVTVSSRNKAPSNDDDKAIKSLETTLAKKLDQIIAVMNTSSRGRPNTGPGIFYHGLARVKRSMISLREYILEWKK